MLCLKSFQISREDKTNFLGPTILYMLHIQDTYLSVLTKLILKHEILKFQAESWKHKNLIGRYYVILNTYIIFNSYYISLNI